MGSTMSSRMLSNAPSGLLGTSHPVGQVARRIGVGLDRQLGMPPAGSADRAAWDPQQPAARHRTADQVDVEDRAWVKLRKPAHRIVAEQLERRGMPKNGGHRRYDSINDLP